MLQSSIGILLRAAVVIALSLSMHTSGAETKGSSAASRTEHVVKRIAPPSLQAGESQHPIKPLLDYVVKEQAYLQRTVRDFSCRVAKRERIDGELQATQYINLQVREEVRRGDTVVQPLSVFAEFLAPTRIKGRLVLYIAGRNNGKLLVRKGGRRFSYVVADFDPLGETAKHESQIPITEIGFNQMAMRTIRILEHDMQIDATGENSKVEQFANAKINSRPCTVLRITHPQPQEGLQFHVADVFVDDELSVPVRLDMYDFPEHPGGEALLLAEYTYTDLKLNIGLSDADFDVARLHAPRKDSATAPAGP